MTTTAAGTVGAMTTSAIGMSATTVGRIIKCAAIGTIIAIAAIGVKAAATIGVTTAIANK